MRTASPKPSPTPTARSLARRIPTRRVPTRRVTRFRRLSLIPANKLFRFRDGTAGLVLHHQHDGNALVLKAGETQAREIRADLLVLIDCREVAG